MCMGHTGPCHTVKACRIIRRMVQDPGVKYLAPLSTSPSTTALARTAGGFHGTACPVHGDAACYQSFMRRIPYHSCRDRNGTETYWKYLSIL